MPAYPLFRVFPLAPPSFSILQMRLLNSPHRSLWSSPSPPKSTSRRIRHRKRSIPISRRCLLCVSITDYQSSDTTVPDSQFDEDLERASGSTTILPADPFQLRDGLLTADDIAALRRRKKGKAVAKYQLRQNNVCVLFRLVYFLALIYPCVAHCCNAETHGGTYSRCRSRGGSYSLTCMWRNVPTFPNHITERNAICTGQDRNLCEFNCEFRIMRYSE